MAQAVVSLFFVNGRQAPRPEVRLPIRSRPGSVVHEARARGVCELLPGSRRLRRPVIMDALGVVVRALAVGALVEDEIAPSDGAALLADDEWRSVRESARGHRITRS